MSNAVLFWQEQSHSNVPGNMKLLLDKETLNLRLLHQMLRRSIVLSSVNWATCMIIRSLIIITSKYLI